MDSAMTDRRAAARFSSVTRWTRWIRCTQWTEWRRSLGLCLAFCGLALGLSSTARAATFTTFDAPGAGTGPGQGTFATSLNPAGAITGYYADANSVFHGFLRAPDGSLTTFDAPGAGAGADLRQGTFPKSINPTGAITGYYIDARNLIHGFLRSSEGAITTFDAPDVGAFLGTFALSINATGAIAGYYFGGATLGYHGFLRAPDGAFTTF